MKIIYVEWEEAENYMNHQKKIIDRLSRKIQRKNEQIKSIKEINRSLCKTITNMQEVIVRLEGEHETN